jgi:predicted N-formylglutamate amidohydrolase
MTPPTLPPRSVADQWPDPVELHGAEGRSPIVLLCEHASNYIPPEYADLGVSHSELQRHIAWDIGAAQVARHLSRLMDATAFLGTYSRLVIDLNRPLGARSSIVARSEATDIPGNVSLSAEERTRRAERIFIPHHAAIEAHLKERVAAGRKTFLVAIHSFTPVYMGNVRPWHVGVLFDKGASLAEAMMARLRASDPTLNVGANVPYQVSIDEDYGLLVHGDHAGNPAILIEIRQDLIAIPEAAEDWAKRLAPILTAVCV